MLCKNCGKESQNKKFCCRSCAMKFRWTDIVYKEKMKNMSLDLWNDDVYTNNMLTIRSSEKFKQKQSTSTKKSMSNNDVRDKCLNAISQYFSIEENRRKHSITQKETWTDEKRKWYSEMMTEKWKDPMFAEKCFNNGKKYKSYNLNNKIIKIQGYENVVLDDLRLNYKDNDIVAGIQHIAQIIKLQYFFNDKNHTYWPDIYVTSTNTIYEVKSPFHYSNEIEKNILKAASAINAGYNFIFAIVEPRTFIIKYETILS